MTTPTSDEKLVQRLGQDDREAFAQIYERYWYRLVRMAYAVLREEELCKDTVQEVFLDLWNRRKTSGIRSLSSYLSQATKFRLSAQLRDGRLKQYHLSHLHRAQEIIETQEQEEREGYRLIYQRIDTLPQRCREVFCLRRVENLTNQEVARRLNISVKTVENQMTKALKKIRLSASAPL